MYTLPEPPYLLLAAGFLASLASGKAFEVTLKQSVQEWATSRSTRILSNLKGMQLFVPFLGISGGVCIFLAAGLMVFGSATGASYLISVIITAATSSLIWFRLGKLLLMLERGGSKAIDLDAF